MPAKVTENDMLRHLWRHFADSWAPIPQVTVAPSDLSPSALHLVTYDGPERPNDGNDRRIDLLLTRRAKNVAKAGEHESLAIEVKVTRADFLSDIRNPAKQEPWKRAATRHAYAVPAGLVHAHEVPEECGLIWVTPPTTSAHGFLGSADVKWVKRAPYTPGHRPQLPLRVINTLIYRLSTFEARTRDWVYVAPQVGTEQEVRASLVAATARADRLERERLAALGKVEAWKKAYALAAGAGVPCAICGRGLKPLRPNAQGGFGAWRHLSADDDAPCKVTDTLAAEVEAREAYDKAPTSERERRLRAAHRFRFDEAVEAEPWRAWVRHAPNDPHPDPDGAPAT